MPVRGSRGSKEDASEPRHRRTDPGTSSDESDRPGFFARSLKPRPPVPASGEVVIRGRTRPISVRRARPTLIGRRYALVYDVEGPRVTAGVIWFALAMGSLALGPIAAAPLFALVAGLAGYQSARAWQTVGSGSNPWVAALAGAGIGGGALFGIGMVGLSILVVVVASVVVATIEVGQRSPVFEAAGTTVQCALFAGLAAAGVVLTLRLEIGAAVTLILLVSAYETGDFIVGSGASSSLEGPFSGIVSLAVVCGVIAVLRVPPFDGAPVFVFGGFAAVACPLGQMAGSAILPSAGARARALRRLDSLIILAPVWALLIGIYLDQLK